MPPLTTPPAPRRDTFARLVGHTRETKIVKQVDELEADAFARLRFAAEHCVDEVVQLDHLRTVAGLPTNRRNVTAIGGAIATVVTARLARLTSQGSGE